MDVFYNGDIVICVCVNEMVGELSICVMYFVIFDVSFDDIIVVMY